MFVAAAVLFTIFSLLYGLFSSAIIYHLKQYTLPGRPYPKIVSTVFVSLSLLFWLFALYFLIKMR